MLARVLIANGSSLNVMPKATLDKLYSTSSQLRTSSIVVRAFNRSKREVMGEITLPIRIRLVTFDITFQVMDIRPAYSCLLGRPWIHTARAIPSSLYQRVKFIVGEKELMISTLTPVEYIEEDEEALETSFQSLEKVGMIGAELEQGGSKLSRASIMAVKILIRGGFQLGKGPGKMLEGIVESMTVQENLGKIDNTNLMSEGVDESSKQDEGESTESKTLVEIERMIERESSTF
ncbi:hypothetical protein CR513_03046, partial [Mucuna pruriens]